MLEEKKSAITRFSNASTDFGSASDDDLREDSEAVLIYPETVCHLFSELPEESLSQYAELKIELQKLYTKFTEELEPVSVRDEKCIKANSITLMPISRARFNRNKN